MIRCRSGNGFVYWRWWLELVFVVNSCLKQYLDHESTGYWGVDHGDNDQMVKMKEENEENVMFISKFQIWFMSRLNQRLLDHWFSNLALIPLVGSENRIWKLIIKMKKREEETDNIIELQPPWMHLPWREYYYIRKMTPFTHTYYMEHAPIYRLDSNPLECKYYNSSTIKWQFANSNNYLVIYCNGSSSLGVFRSWLVACCSETTNINPIILSGSGMWSDWYYLTT